MLITSAYHLLHIPFYAKAEIGSTLSAYTTSTELHTDLYSKAKMNIILDTYTTTTQRHDGFSARVILTRCFQLQIK